MENLKNWLILILLIAVACMWSMHSCRPQPVREIHDTIRLIEKKIYHRDSVIVKYKERAERIVYRTRFDTIATIDTVLVELIKCDSAVHIRDTIIIAQDSTIRDLKGVVELHKKDKEIAKKDARKERRKEAGKGFVAGFLLGFFTGIVVSK